MVLKNRFMGALAISGLVLAGCGPTASVDNPAPQITASVRPTEIALELLSIKDVPTQLAARQGKVVVLDMWATW